MTTWDRLTDLAMRLYTPSDVNSLAGISADKLRDWRRRGFLENCGGYALPGGDAYTTNPDDPRLSNAKDRHYGLGDIVRLLIVTELVKLKTELSFAFAVAERVEMYIFEWSRPEDPTSCHDLRINRFMIAYPHGMGRRIDGSSVEMVRLGDLNRISSYIGSAAVVVDLQNLAESLPESIRLLMREQA